MLSLVINARHESGDIALCNDRILYNPHKSPEKPLIVYIFIFLLTQINKLNVKFKKKKLTKLLLKYISVLQKMYIKETAK